MKHWLFIRHIRYLIFSWRVWRGGRANAPSEAEFQRLNDIWHGRA